MPFNISEIMKISSHHGLVTQGEYPGVVAGIIYHGRGERKERIQFLFQVRLAKDRAYIPSNMMCVSLNEESDMFTFLSPLAGATTSTDLLSWLAEYGFVKDGVFNEQYFLGYPVLVHNDCRHKKHKTGMYNIISGIHCASRGERISVDCNWPIPGYFRSDRSSMVVCDGLAYDIF